jgi:hypothetical protein
MKVIHFTVFTYSFKSSNSAPATPIGVIAFGAYEDQAFYAFVGKENAGTLYGKENIEIMIMNDLPGWFKMVKEGVDELMKQMISAQVKCSMDDLLKQIIQWNHGKTFHVSDVQDVEVAMDYDVGAAVMDRLSDYMKDRCRFADGTIDFAFVYGFNAQMMLPETKLLN